MAINDRTLDFHEILKQHHSAYDEKRRGIARTASKRLQATLGKEYITEAYHILDHIKTLAQMLANIRKPYLNVESRTFPLSRQSSKGMADSLDQSWSGSRHLSHEERDLIDMQARDVLSSCAERVKRMEASEKRRAELYSRNSNPFTKWLPTVLMHDEASMISDVVAAHRSSITWYLNRRLAEASQTQKEMQEERIKRQLERTRTLGSGAAREALSLSLGESAYLVPQEEKGKGGWLEEASSTLASGFAATIGGPSSVARSLVSDRHAQLPSDDEDDEIELSQSQILQFEMENANILRSVQDTLESAQQVEARLLEISQLQAELVMHLTQQTELTDRLFEDAIATTSTVEKGNMQLREAKRRAKDGRIFILVFLIGASLSLLFLHYY